MILTMFIGFRFCIKILFLHIYTNKTDSAKNGGASYYEPLKVNALKSPEKGVYSYAGFSKFPIPFLKAAFGVVKGGFLPCKQRLIGP